MRRQTLKQDVWLWTKRLAASTLPTLLAGCFLSNSVIEVAAPVEGKGVASYCDTVAGLDLRPSHKDTFETQKTMGVLQAAGADCNGG